MKDQISVIIKNYVLLQVKMLLINDKQLRTTESRDYYDDLFGYDKNALSESDGNDIYAKEIEVL